MADSPCTCCGNGFSGRAFIAYINFYDDRELVQKRVRLCMNCIADHFLVLVEHSDARNERGIWCDYREQESWVFGAHSENTDPVMDAVTLSRQRNAITSTFSEATATNQTDSATSAGSPPQSQVRTSSKRLKRQGTNSKITDASQASSAKTSLSESKWTSKGSRPSETKSTGS